METTRRRLLGAGMTLACLPRGLSAAQPRTPADWLVRWLNAFNDPEPAAYPEFVRSSIPALIPYLDEDLAVREASGGLVLLRSQQTGASEITAWVRDRNWDRLSKVVLSIGEGRIEDLSFAGAPEPTGLGIARIKEEEALRLASDKLRGEANAGRFSGTLLVAKGQQVRLREAHGAQNGANARPITDATRFCIGSAGKMFTAVGVLQRVQAGKLALSDTIAQRLPGFPDTPLARAVTIRHLLTHSGGTGDVFGPEHDAHASELRTPADYVRLFGRREALFTPGSRWGYSNFGFILLGAILEESCDEDWAACLRRIVLEPAGMAATSPHPTIDDTAIPLNGAAATGLKPLPFYLGSPAGGGYSTVGDLHRFASALARGILLDEAHMRLLTTAAIPAGSAHWSLGLRVSRRNGADCYGHRGSAPGVSADFAIYPRSGHVVAVLSNRGHPHASNVAEFIGARLPIA